MKSDQKTIKSIQKISTKELREMWKWAESEISEYDKLIQEIKVELRGRQK